jgi:hypothetical protein
MIETADLPVRAGRWRWGRHAGPRRDLRRVGARRHQRGDLAANGSGGADERALGFTGDDAVGRPALRAASTTSSTPSGRKARSAARAGAWRGTVDATYNHTLIRFGLHSFRQCD